MHVSMYGLKFSFYIYMLTETVIDKNFLSGYHQTTWLSYLMIIVLLTATHLLPDT